MRGRDEGRVTEKGARERQTRGWPSRTFRSGLAARLESSHHDARRNLQPELPEHIQLGRNALGSEGGALASRSLTALLFSPDGKRLASARSGGTRSMRHDRELFSTTSNSGQAAEIAPGSEKHPGYSPISITRPV